MANGARNHQFFVRVNHSDVHTAGRRGNHAITRCVVLLFEFDSKKCKTIANPRTDWMRVLADTAGKHQRVQSAHRGRE